MPDNTDTEIDSGELNSDIEIDDIDTDDIDGTDGEREPPTPPDADEEDDDAPPPDAIPPGLQGYVSRLRAENADRRVQLRKAEDEREYAASWVGFVTDKLRVSQSREVEQIASERMVSPSDIWNVTAVEQLLTEDGDIDPVKVRKVIADLPPHWLHQNRKYGGAGVSGAVSPDRHQPSNSWAQALRGSPE